MYPSICLACDPDAARARTAVSRMLAELNAAGHPRVTAACADGWAAAVVPPPAHEPTCGADIYCDGRDLLLWTGEIFLPAELSEPCATDCPHEQTRAISYSLLKALQKHGLDALAGLDGAFCGAWLDTSRQTWHVFNDRFGLLPVFWQIAANRLYVCSRAAITWLGSGEPLRIDSQGVAGLLRTQNVIDDRTLIEGVHWLQRGHGLIWKGQSYSLASYCDFQQAPVLIQDAGEAADAYVDALRTCVRRHSVAEAPLMLGISGGLDSRLFLAALEELGRLPACFSAGLPFGSDVRFGRQLARLVGAAHEWLPLNADTLRENLTEAIVVTDGLHNVGHLPPAAAMRAYLRNHDGSVLLEGFFNGVAGGATVPSDIENDHRPAHEQPWAARALHTGGSISLIDQLLEPVLSSESLAAWQDCTDRAYQQAGSADPQCKAEYTIQSARRSHMDTLGTAMLREDVLVRNPATDLVMVRWFQAVSPALRRKRSVFLEVLRRWFPRFARVPRSDTGGMPIAADRWLREYHWQREKLYRLWAGRKYPAFRKWGSDGNAIRAWSCATLLRHGAFNMLLDPHARILEWVRREAVLDLWRQASADPLKGMPLLGLWTIETMVGWLAGSSTSVHRYQSSPSVRFLPIEMGRSQSSRNPGPAYAEVH